jgi:IclR family KDG regulon transcriptional repressor
MKTLKTSSVNQLPHLLTKSTVKAFRILEILCEEGEMRISQLSKKTDLKKSNVHRLLATLIHLGYVGKESVTSLYFPTLKVFEIGSAILNRMELQPIVRPFLEKLGNEFHETVNVSVLDGWEIICIEKVESSESLKTTIKVGTRVPAYSTASGKVLLANLAEPHMKDFLEHRKLVPLTKNTISSPEQLGKDLTQIQIQGYGIDNEEFSEGVRCIAAPIRNFRGKVIAAIGIAGPSVRMTHDKLFDLKEPILNTAKEISRKLGYQ